MPEHFWDIQQIIAKNMQKMRLVLRPIEGFREVFKRLGNTLRDNRHHKYGFASAGVMFETGIVDKQAKRSCFQAGYSSETKTLSRRNPRLCC